MQDPKEKEKWMIEMKRELKRLQVMTEGFLHALMLTTCMHRNF